MITKQSVIIKLGEDLKDSTKDKLKAFMFSSVVQDHKDKLMEIYGADQYDLGRVDSDAVREGVEQAVEHSINRAFAEVEIEVKL